MINNNNNKNNNKQSAHAKDSAAYIWLPSALQTGPQPSILFS